MLTVAECDGLWEKLLLRAKKKEKDKGMGQAASLPLSGRTECSSAQQLGSAEGGGMWARAIHGDTMAMEHALLPVTLACGYTPVLHSLGALNGQGKAGEGHWHSW